MGKRGPQPTPTESLKKRGSWRAKTREDYDVDVKSYKRPPPAPKSLDSVAALCWRETAKRLTDLGVLAPSDLRTLERYCVTWSRWAMVSEDEHDLYLKFDAALLKAEAHFGLTPSTRSKLPLKKEKEETPDDATAKYLRVVK